jgi:hypothetical protein
MYDCPTCRHHIIRKGNSLCTRTRTWATLKTTDQPVFCVLERRAADTWKNVNRRLAGDVCGPDGLHWEAKP